jgi:hypothetical protein
MQNLSITYCAVTDVVAKPRNARTHDRRHGRLGLVPRKTLGYETPAERFNGIVTLIQMNQISRRTPRLGCHNLTPFGGCPGAGLTKSSASDQMAL